LPRARSEALGKEIKKKEHVSENLKKRKKKPLPRARSETLGKEIQIKHVAER
jgi:hypothetical protein